ncbi:uncharacterized protein LOC144450086 [Glandiceps talaboti]
MYSPSGVNSTPKKTRHILLGIATVVFLVSVAIAVCAIYYYKTGYGQQNDRLQQGPVPDVIDDSMTSPQHSKTPAPTIPGSSSTNLDTTDYDTRTNNWKYFDQYT